MSGFLFVGIFEIAIGIAIEIENKCNTNTFDPDPASDFDPDVKKRHFTKPSRLTMSFFLIQYDARWQPPSVDRPLISKESMFFIAGVQPKTKRVDGTPQRCPLCGLMQAYKSRVDHYLSLFFIPLVRVKKGAPVVWCEHCRRPADEDFQWPPRDAPPSPGVRVCVACGKTFDAAFKYCPYCGQRA
jgi:hypothetical protein